MGMFTASAFLYRAGTAAKFIGTAQGTAGCGCNRAGRAQISPERYAGKDGAKGEKPMNMQNVLQQTRIVLGDSAALKFSDAQLQAALQSVLETVNGRVPRIACVELTQTPADHMLSITPEVEYRDVLAVECLDLHPPRSVAFIYERMDGSLKVWLLPPLPELNYQHWRVKLVCDHQLQGMDGAETSTIPDSCLMLLVYGVAARALQMRNAQFAESANQASGKMQNAERMAVGFEAQFERLLQAWQFSQPVVADVLPSSGWPPI
jgi:hypothetical protein